MTTTTKTAEITDEQIATLSAEAAEAGDGEQVALCERAVAGDSTARAKCARVISDAQAQEKADVTAWEAVDAGPQW